MLLAVVLDTGVEARSIAVTGQYPRSVSNINQSLPMPVQKVTEISSAATQVEPCSCSCKIPENIPEKIYKNCGTITEHISDYLGHHLNPFVSQSRSYVKDTNHFLSRLSKLGKIPEGAMLCTVDVVGLYPSIPHGEGLEAIREALDRRENPGVATDTQDRNQMF